MKSELNSGMRHRGLGWRPGLMMLGAGLAVALGVLAASVPGMAPMQAAGAVADKVDFTRDILPILTENCYKCHDGSRKGGLQLNTASGMLRGGDSGLAIAPAGKSGQSLMIQRLTAEKEADRMPPTGKAPRLAEEKINLLKRWIDEGAQRPQEKEAEHWAYLKPVRRPLPTVKNEAWVRNGIDLFILAKLESLGLSPTAEADEARLLRRLWLDLTGLPPGVEDVEAYLADPSPDKYERAIEKLLASPAYGERWGSWWLDKARYADTQGYEKDNRRTIWRYRDWVIDAFNRGMTLDQFTREQIAGDLLPGATTEQILATAFHRNTMTNTEGGTDNEEFRTEAVRDRLSATMQIWMATSIKCCQCHSHKYDPLTQREYYEMFAFFNNTEDQDNDDESPVMPTPSPAQERQKQSLQNQIAMLNARIEQAGPELAAGQAKWLEAAAERQKLWRVLKPSKLTAKAGTILKAGADGVVKAEGAGPDKDEYTLEIESDLKGISGLKLEVIPDAALPMGGSGRSSSGNFVLTSISAAVQDQGRADAGVGGRYLRIELPGNSRMLSLAEVQVFSGGKNMAIGGKASQSSTDFDGPANLAIDGNTNGDYSNAKSTTHTAIENNPWWEVDLGEPKSINAVTIWNRTDNQLAARLDGAVVKLLDGSRKEIWRQTMDKAPAVSRMLSIGGAGPIRFKAATASHVQDGAEMFKPGRSITDKPDNKSGWAIGGATTAAQEVVFVLDVARKAPSGLKLTINLSQNYGGGHTIGRFRLWAMQEGEPTGALPAAVSQAIAVEPAGRTDAQKKAITDHYRTLAPELTAIRTQIASVTKELAAIKPVTTPILRELQGKRRRTTHLHIKGNFMTKGAPVKEGSPAVFHPLPATGERNRLMVANWLTDPENPLTGRVLMNRYWEQIFGVGIVRTSEDFGTQSEKPSHPELLDWLAIQFMESGWDVKSMHRLIVSSATYRQSSKASDELLAVDLDNRLLGRGPRFRMEAEMIRDQALAVSGLLSRKMMGPSVMPPQPAGVWQVVYSGDNWITSAGGDKYRRGLYTFWRRTSPYPSMVTFDAPSREFCVVKRIRTNTPLQALVTLNDPAYVEAAQAISRTLMMDKSAGDAQRASRAVMMTLGRKATENEVARLVKLHETELAHFKANLPAAKLLATEGIGPAPAGMDEAELAAWTVVGNVLLNLDELLTKG